MYQQLMQRGAKKYSPPGGARSARAPSGTDDPVCPSRPSTSDAEYQQISQIVRQVENSVQAHNQTQHIQPSFGQQGFPNTHQGQGFQ